VNSFSESPKEDKDEWDCLSVADAGNVDMQIAVQQTLQMRLLKKFKGRICLCMEQLSAFFRLVKFFLMHGTDIFWILPCFFFWSINNFSR
jgi:hypothetical protein